MATAEKTGRVVRHLSIAYFTPAQSPDGNKTVLVRTARRGDLVLNEDLAEGEVKRLEGLGAFLPEGASPADAEREREAIVDLYRGQRGDSEAMGRAMRRAAERQSLADTTGGIVDFSGRGQDGDITNGGGAADPLEAGIPALADHIRANKLNADDTIALARDDKQRAARVLEAEHLATDGSPRQNVLGPLQKLIDG